MLLPPDVAPFPAPESSFDALLRSLTPLVPIPALLVILPAIYLFFRSTWRELDEEAHKHRGETLAQGRADLRPFVALAICAVVLTMQEYYGGRGYFEISIKPHLLRYEVLHPRALKLF